MSILCQHSLVLQSTNPTKLGASITIFLKPNLTNDIVHAYSMIVVAPRVWAQTHHHSRTSLAVWLAKHNIRCVLTRLLQCPFYILYTNYK